MASTAVKPLPRCTVENRREITGERSGSYFGRPNPSGAAHAHEAGCPAVRARLPQLPGHLDFRTDNDRGVFASSSITLFSSTEDGACPASSDLDSAHELSPVRNGNCDGVPEAAESRLRVCTPPTRSAPARTCGWRRAVGRHRVSRCTRPSMETHPRRPPGTWGGGVPGSACAHFATALGGRPNQANQTDCVFAWANVAAHRLKGFGGTHVSRRV
jgi:hypothetical protein